MKLTLVLIALVSMAALAAAGEFGSRKAFSAFTAKYGKAYSDDAAAAAAYETFKGNWETAQALTAADAAAGGSATFGMSPFMDMTPDQFAARYLMRKGAVASAVAARDAQADAPASVLDASALAGKLPAAYDWRDASPPVITPVKNQGQCGSCWAFSATEELESMWALGGHPLVELAPQQIVDCDTVDQGCNGGDTVSAYAYIKKAGGMVPEKDYPYEARDGKCKHHIVEKDTVASLKGFNYATDPKARNETLMAANLVAHGPISICINAANWQFYTSGVMSHKACGSSSPSALDHCVQVTGYGEDKDSGKYWAVRNSWAESWGVKGYIWLAFGDNTCGIADEATIVDINSSGTHTTGPASSSSSSGASSSGGSSSSGYSSSGSSAARPEYTSYTSYGDQPTKPNYTSSSSSSSFRG